MKKDIEYYLSLPYQVVLTPLKEEDGGGWLATIPDLKGCMTDGETQEEALINLLDAKKAWIKTAIKRGQQIPLPRSYEDEEYSGKFTLRLPRFLHKAISLAAKKDNMSLNSYLLSLISLSFGKEIGRNQTNDGNYVNVSVFNNPEFKIDIKQKYNMFLQGLEQTWSFDNKQPVGDIKRW
jgi:antitoxin HicB